MSKIDITLLTADDADFRAQLDKLLDRSQQAQPEIESTVRAIVDDVRSRGDAAVLEYTNRFDQNEAASVQDLELDPARLKQAFEGLPGDRAAALQQASDRIRRYHERQKQESWSYTEDNGTLLGQKVTPLDRVGLYVPGGKAAYPSSVLMNALPAKVAGVQELIMVVPAPKGELNDMVLAAAYLAGVTRVFTIGGAQAVAALAFGTETLPQVDKIVGPGNIYVATAKRMVFGQVDIDMIAGPSEIVVVCDGQTDPQWVAMDLFSQAEHDELAQSILISTDDAYVNEVKRAMESLIDDMPRKQIISTSLKDRGALISVADEDAAAELCNYIAPEHLELSVADPQALADKVRHAGAIFLGRYTAEALGDYCAGPNHVLPTSGTARFSSPLGVYDFQKRTSLIQCSDQGADELGRIAAVLADGEGLPAHEQSARYRVK
ncbi:MAG: histidinol dehydrogenase [Acidiferrobacterales bacterium]